VRLRLELTEAAPGSLLNMAVQDPLEGGRELLRMDVRLEAFNLFNRTIWGAPVSTDFNNNNFGLINTTANSPRQMQLGLKVYW